MDGGTRPYLQYAYARIARSSEGRLEARFGRLAARIAVRVAWPARFPLAVIDLGRAEAHTSAHTC
jgi:hypothetical protein